MKMKIIILTTVSLLLFVSCNSSSSPANENEYSEVYDPEQPWRM